MPVLFVSVMLRQNDLQLQTLAALMVLEGLETSEGSTSGYNLMAEAGLVLLEVVAVVDLLVVVLAVVYGGSVSIIGLNTWEEYVPQKPIVNVRLI